MFRGLMSQIISSLLALALFLSVPAHAVTIKLECVDHDQNAQLEYA